MLIALLMAISSDRGFADFSAADFNPPSSTFSIDQIHPARYEYSIFHQMERHSLPIDLSHCRIFNKVPSRDLNVLLRPFEQSRMRLEDCGCEPGSVRNHFAQHR